MERPPSFVPQEICPANCCDCGVQMNPRPITSNTASPAWGTRFPGGIGVKLAEPERDVVVMIGDGTYLMMNSEIVTAVAEGLTLTIVDHR